MNALRPDLALVAVILACASSCRQSSPAEESVAVPGGWREAFEVDKSKLASKGTSPLFVLEPGATRVYTAEDAKLTITVLDATELVDGVTARVLEEREEEDGQLVEISRNFLAIDPATGDVYYFGEDVDIYKNGKVSSHGGAWR